MKTKEELTALKKEVEALNKKLAELSEDELAVVTGGAETFIIPGGGSGPYEQNYYHNGINTDFQQNSN